MDNEMKNIFKKLFCKHDYVFIRMLYGDEINVHNGKRHEYCCKKMRYVQMGLNKDLKQE